MIKSRNIFKAFVAFLLIAMLSAGIFLMLGPSQKEQFLPKADDEAQSVILTDDDFEIEGNIVKSLTEDGKAKFVGDGLFNVTITISQEATFGDGKLANRIFKDYTTRLARVEFTPETKLTGLGDCIFDSCSALKEVIFPQSLKTIGTNAFNDCSVLQEINFPKGLQTIGQNAFAGCIQLKSVVIPDSVTKIEQSAFNGTQNLISITLHANKNLQIGTNGLGHSSNKNHFILYFTFPDSASLSLGEQIFTMFPDDIYKPIIVAENSAKAEQLKKITNFQEYADYVTYPVDIIFKSSSTESQTHKKIYKQYVYWTFNEEKDIWQYDTSYHFPNSETVNWYDSTTGKKSTYRDLDSLLTKGTIKTSYTYLRKTDIATCEITLDWNSKPFTGENLVPAVQTELKLDKDYSLSYKKARDNNPDTPGDLINKENIKKAGVYYVIVDGKGDEYAESTSLRFEITLIDLSDPSVEISGIPEEIIYDGRPHSVIPTIKLNNSSNPYPLEYGDDFIVIYSPESPTKCGDVKLTIEPSSGSDFDGRVEKTFKIVPRSLNPEKSNITVSINERYTYTGVQIKPYISVELYSENGDQIYFPEGDLEPLEYDENVNAGNGGVTIRAKEGGNFTDYYYFQFTIYPAPMNTTRVSKIADVTFDGEEHKPSSDDIKITLSSVSGKEYNLVFEKDFTLSYADDYTNYGNKGVEIKAVEKGNFTGSINANFKINKRPIIGLNKSFELTLEEQKYTFTGSKIEPKVTEVKLIDDGKQFILTEKDYKINYGETSDNINAGDGKIVIETTNVLESNYVGDYTYTFTISQADIGKATISGITESIAFDGKEHNQEPTLTFGAYKLFKDTDYTLSYSSKTIDQGVKTITISAKEDGNFFGSTSTTFEITKISIELGHILYGHLEIILEQEEYTFNGSYIEPEVLEVKIVYNSGATLTLRKNIDYRVEYSENKSAGSGVIKIITLEDGNFFGEQKRTFKIDYANINSTTIAKIENVLFDNAQHYPKDLDIRLGEYKLKEDEDYELRYNDSDYKNQGLKVITIVAKNYSDFTGSTTTSFTIEQRSLISGVEVELAEPSYFYRGEKIEPTVSSVKIVLSGEQKLSLTQETDFTVSYGTNLEAGEGIVLITARPDSNYKETYRHTFTIGQRNIHSGLTVTLGESSFTYLGRPITPAVTNVVLALDDNDGDKTLTLTENDYTVNYGSNQNAGEGKVIISAKEDGNYTGSFDYIFTINPAQISTTTVDPIESITYDGVEHKPRYFEVKLGANYVLSESVDYELQFNDSDYTKQGEKTITIAAKGNNFTGTKYITFTIGQRSISLGLDVTLAQTTYSYTGSNIEPEITSAILTYDGDKKLTLTSDDYTINYGDNLNVGSGSVTITAKNDGNYFGSFTTYFAIEQATNEFVLEFSLEDFRPGDDITEPNVTSKFGNVVIKYFDMNGNEYQFSELKNSRPGKYRAVVSVEATSNYSGIESVVYEFEILGESKGISLWVWVSIAGAGVLIVAISLLIIFKSKIKKKYEKQ